MGAIALGDPRRTRWAVHTLTALAANPMISPPAALAESAALKAIHRLVHSDVVTVEALLTPHWQATRMAAGAAAVCLLVQDTTGVLAVDWGGMTDPGHRPYDHGALHCRSARLPLSCLAAGGGCCRQSHPLKGVVT